MLKSPLYFSREMLQKHDVDSLLILYAHKFKKVVSSSSQMVRDSSWLWIPKIRRKKYRGKSFSCLIFTRVLGIFFHTFTFFFTIKFFVFISMFFACKLYHKHSRVLCYWIQIHWGIILRIIFINFWSEILS